MKNGISKERQTGNRRSRTSACGRRFLGSGAVPRRFQALNGPLPCGLIPQYFRKRITQSDMRLREWGVSPSAETKAYPSISLLLLESRGCAPALGRRGWLFPSDRFRLCREGVGPIGSLLMISSCTISFFSFQNFPGPEMRHPRKRDFNRGGTHLKLEESEKTIK